MGTFWTENYPLSAGNSSYPKRCTFTAYYITQSMQTICKKNGRLDDFGAKDLIIFP